LPDATGWLALNGWEPQLHDRANGVLELRTPPARVVRWRFQSRLPYL